MRKRAIGKIIACSIVGVILTGILLAAIGVGAAGLIDATLPERSARNVVEKLEQSVERLPRLNFLFFGIPVLDDDPTDGYSIGDASYDAAPKKLVVEWATGKVVVIASDAATGVTLTEYAGSVDPLTALPGGVEEGDRMRHKLAYGELTVREFTSVTKTWKSLQKTLLVVLPTAQLDKLTLEIASADVELTDLTVDQLKLDFASGSLTAQNCALNRVDYDVASGSGEFTATTIGSLDVDCASGKLTFDLLNTPNNVDIDLASGNVRFILPADASFTVDADALSGSVKIDGFAIESEHDGKKVIGGGASRFDFDLTSGKITIEARPGNTF